jgi:N-methylhydantoinase A
MSYLGQTHTVAVSLPVTLTSGTTNVTQTLIRTAFEDAYRAAYGRLLENIPIRVLNLRVAVIGTRPKFDLSALAPGADASVAAARTGERQVWVDGGWHTAAIYDRLVLPVGAEVPGPALLEQPDTTIFIDPDLTGTVDGFGNLIIERKAEA